jgi:predicted ATPase
VGCEFGENILMQVEQLDLFETTEPSPDTYPAGFLDETSVAPRLKQVRIDGLKTFDRTTVVLPLLTVLTGPNNSGKSTILQAIALGYECLRRCVEPERWKLADSGRAVSEFQFLPVNDPRDLWYKRIWKPTKDKERYVEIALDFLDGRSLTFRIRFLFGLLNIKLSDSEGDFDGDTLKALLAAGPVLLPATPGPASHEDYLTLASVHKMLAIREPSRVVRNILKRLQEANDQNARRFVDSVLQRYFGATLADIAFDERRDLEIRAPLSQGEYALDIVSSGSGLNQMLQLACVIAWRKPALVLLDEPDAHLHSSVQAQLFDFLADLSDRDGVQIVLSTHSRDLISQAPLESIVPVDPTRELLEPLKSLDHLLLEYQRYGSLSNVDLALLYQTKRCVFVEGPTDARLLPRIAERLGLRLFTGSKQAVPFEFQGVEKLKFLPDLVRLFERLVGGSLHWSVLRDSDSAIPEVRKLCEAAGAALGAAYFHQWERHSLENYLLEPGLLKAAIDGRASVELLDEGQIIELLRAAITEIEDAVTGTFVTHAQRAYRDFKLSDQPHDAGAAAATRFLRNLDSLEKKLIAYPGKRIFGAFVGKLQAACGFNLRIEDVVGQITRENVPSELRECLTALSQRFIARP